MSSFENLGVSATCLLRAPLLEFRNTEDLSYVAAWLLSRFLNKDSELFMSSRGFGENLPCPAHMCSMFFKSARSAGDELFRKQPVRHRCLCLSVDPLYSSKNHTQLQHESAKKYEFPVTYLLLSAAFRLQLKTLSCRRDGSSSRILFSYTPKKTFKITYGSSCCVLSSHHKNISPTLYGTSCS
jgi:hypothetical protein